MAHGWRQDRGNVAPKGMEEEELAAVLHFYVTYGTYMLGSVLTQVQTATLTIFVPYHHRLPTVYIR